MRNIGLVVVGLFCLVGCSSSPSIIGKWDMTGGNVLPGSKMVTEFKDKTFTANAEVSNAGMSMKFSFSGDYTFDGKKLKMTGKTVSLDDSALPAIAKPMAATIKQEIEKAVLVTSEGDAKLEGDVFSFVSEGKTTTFTRVK